MEPPRQYPTREQQRAHVAGLRKEFATRHRDMLQVLQRNSARMANAVYDEFEHAGCDETLPVICGRLAIKFNMLAEYSAPSDDFKMTAGMLTLIASRYPADQQLLVQFTFTTDQPTPELGPATLAGLALSFQQAYTSQTGAIRKEFHPDVIDQIRRQLDHPLPKVFFEMIRMNYVSAGVAHALYAQHLGANPHPSVDALLKDLPDPTRQRMLSEIDSAMALLTEQPEPTHSPGL